MINFMLKSLDFSQKMTKKEYDKKLEKYQRKLNLLVRSRKFRKISAILVFEGSDAAGKGGGIRRVTGALDPRSYRIIPIAAPTEEEKAPPLPLAILAAYPEERQLHHLRPLLVRPGARGEGRGLLLARPTGCAPMGK